MTIYNLVKNQEGKTSIEQTSIEIDPKMIVIKFLQSFNKSYVDIAHSWQSENVVAAICLLCKVRDKMQQKWKKIIRPKIIFLVQTNCIKKLIITLYCVKPV